MARVALGAARWANSIARAEGAHALLRGQRRSDFDHNIFHFRRRLEDWALEYVMRTPASVLDKDEESPVLDPSVAPRLLAVASRVVRVAATYDDEYGRVVPELTTGGSGLVLGNHVLTAAHVVAESAQGRLSGKLSKIYVDASVICPIQDVQDLASWKPVKFDQGITSALKEIDQRVRTKDVDGSTWSHNGVVAVLNFFHDEDSATFSRLARPLQGKMDGWFARSPPHLQPRERHYVVGYPSVPTDSMGREVADAAALLWHGREPITSRQLHSILRGYECLILSRGTSLLSPTRSTGRADEPATPSSGYASSASTGSVTSEVMLQRHCANALSGMGGGPVMNSSGHIVGMHVGGREKTGDYNMYVGMDHPALATAVKMICERQ